MALPTAIAAAAVTDAQGEALARTSPRYFPGEPTVIVAVTPYRPQRARAPRPATAAGAGGGASGNAAGAGGNTTGAGGAAGVIGDDGHRRVLDLYCVEVEHVEARRVWVAVHPWEDFQLLHKQLRGGSSGGGDTAEGAWLQGKWTRDLPTRWR